MISDLIVTAFLAGLDAVLSLLPSFDVSYVDDGFRVGTVVGKVNQVIPIVLILTLAAVAVGIRLILNLFDVGLFVYHQFWGAS